MAQEEAMEKQVLQLNDKLHVATKNGEEFILRPGPYGKGIAIVPHNAVPGASLGRGRKPRPGTIKLREKLERDAKAGKLDEATTYFRWLVKEDSTISKAVARQIVYREMRNFTSGEDSDSEE